MTSKRIRYATLGINHGFAYGQNNKFIDAGCDLVSFWAKDPQEVDKFAKSFPQARAARTMSEVMEDESIDFIFSTEIHSERAAIGIAAMRHGKDFLIGKPGFTDFAQLAEARRVHAETGRRYLISCVERLGDKATVKAMELVKAGVIGTVVQTIGIGPHQVNNYPRQPWFFERAKYGGILVDIGSHEMDQFLHFTGSTEAEILSSQVGNMHHPEHPELEDFGDFTVRGNGGAGYARLDWLSPDTLGTWGDLRLFILGTDGSIEVRKNIDIGRGSGGQLYLVTKTRGVEHIDCSEVALPFLEQFKNDVINRTEDALTQHHCFTLAELVLKAQAKAIRVGHLAPEKAAV